jgi:hypothetical protein
MQNLIDIREVIKMKYTDKYKNFATEYQFHFEMHRHG